MVAKVPCSAEHCFELVKEGVELNQFHVMKVLKKKQTQICWNPIHNWNDMRTSRKKILTFVAVVLLLEHEFLAYSLSKEAFENGIDAEDFLETVVGDDVGQEVDWEERNTVDAENVLVVEVDLFSFHNLSKM